MVFAERSLTQMTTVLVRVRARVRARVAAPTEQERTRLEDDFLGGDAAKASSFVSNKNDLNLDRSADAGAQEAEESEKRNPARPQRQRQPKDVRRRLRQPALYKTTLTGNFKLNPLWDFSNHAGMCEIFGGKRKKWEMTQDI